MSKLRLLINTIRNDESINFIQAFAFSFLLSLAPLLTIFVVLFKQLALDTDFIISIVSNYLPMEEVIEFIKYIQANNTEEIISLIILLVTTLFLSSRSVYSFLKFSSDIENTNYPNWYLRILAFGGQLIFIVLIVVLILIFSFTNNLRYLFIFITLFFGFVVYYRNLSFKHRRLRDHWKGALVTSFLLALMGIFFLTYIANFTNYESLYGPLSSLMVILLSVYIISYIIFIGFLVNYVNYDGDDETIHLKNFTKLKDNFERILKRKR